MNIRGASRVRALQSTLVYSLKIYDVNKEDYYIEDVTSVMADSQAVILKIIEETIPKTPSATIIFEG